MALNYKNEIERYQKFYKELEPKLEKPRNKAYTTIVFSFLVVSLFGWYAIRPTIQTILLLKREIKDKTELSKKMEEKIAALIEAQAYYQEIEPLLPAVDQALPPIADAVPLLIQLRNLASASATTISAIQFPTVPITSQEIAAPVSKNGVKTATSKQQTFDITLTVRGPFSGIQSFIEGLTVMRRISSVESITIAPGQAERTSSSSAQLNAKLLQLALRIKAYYLVK